MVLPEYVSDYISRLNKAGFDAYVVGGCVRDLLLNTTPEDWDICTIASPDEIIEVFKDCKIIKTGIKHGTVTVIKDHKSAEITTFRSDGEYIDNRRPSSVEFVDSLDLDLMRRDFTINAMAYSPKSGIVDLFGGRYDLEKRLIRAVGNPIERFNEDALRIMRGLRFSSILDFKIQSETKEAIHSLKENLNNVSGERIWVELKKLFMAKTCGKTLSNYRDIFSVALNIGYKAGEVDPHIIDKLPYNMALRLFFCCLFLSENNDIFKNCTNAIRRLKVDNDTKKTVLAFAELMVTPLPDNLAETRWLVGKFSFEIMEGFFALIQYINKADYSDIKGHLSKIKKDNLCCSIKELAINGNDLIENGVTDGKKIGETLYKALALVIDKNIVNDKKTLLSRLFL